MLHFYLKAITRFAKIRLDPASNGADRGDDGRPCYEN
jgi:hypothetical protein